MTTPPTTLHLVAGFMPPAIDHSTRWILLVYARDNCILQMYGFEHKSLASSRVKRTRNETSVPLEVKDDPGLLHPSFKAVKVLNQIVYELPAEHPLADSRPLWELLGHTPSQVLGCGLLVSPLLEEFQQDVAPLVHQLDGI